MKRIASVKESGYVLWSVLALSFYLQSTPWFYSERLLGEASRVC